MVGIVDKVHDTAVLAEHGNSRISLELGDRLRVDHDGIPEREGVHASVRGSHLHQQGIGARFVDLEHRIVGRRAIRDARAAKVVIFDDIPLKIGILWCGIVLDTEVQRGTSRQVKILHVDDRSFEYSDVDGIGA